MQKVDERHPRRQVVRPPLPPSFPLHRRRASLPYISSLSIRQPAAARHARQRRQPANELAGLWAILARGVWVWARWDGARARGAAGTLNKASERWNFFTDLSFFAFLRTIFGRKLKKKGHARAAEKKKQREKREKNEKSEKQRENGRYLVPDFKRDSLLRRTGASLFRVFLVKRRGFVKERREVEPSKGEEEYVTCLM